MTRLVASVVIVQDGQVLPIRPPGVSIQTGCNVSYTGMAALLIGQPDPNFKPWHQQIRTARGHPSGPGLNQLAQGGIKPEPQLNYLYDTP